MSWVQDSPTQWRHSESGVVLVRRYVGVERIARTKPFHPSDEPGWRIVSGMATGKWRAGLSPTEAMRLAVPEPTPAPKPAPAPEPAPALARTSASPPGSRGDERYAKPARQEPHQGSMLDVLAKALEDHVERGVPLPMHPVRRAWLDSQGKLGSSHA